MCYRSIRLHSFMAGQALASTWLHCQGHSSWPKSVLNTLISQLWFSLQITLGVFIRKFITNVFCFYSLRTHVSFWLIWLHIGKVLEFLGRKCYIFCLSSWIFIYFSLLGQVPTFEESEKLLHIWESNNFLFMGFIYLFFYL